MDVKQRIGAVIFITKTNGLNKFILHSLVYLNGIGRPFAIQNFHKSGKDSIV